ncbi:hypothetical protein I4U23_014592 [Adineta vaga]|nr:hypothetical protein I4U23_014592 [Adineta vaga]
MTSPIKFENLQNKQQLAMVKNLHLSEVITAAPPPPPLNMHHFNHINAQHPYPHQSLVDPIEMTKLLSNITTNNSTIRKSYISSTMDQTSRLNQFSWEEIEGRYLPVIYRYENSLCHRYTSKMYVENTLFQSESWQRHLVLARSLPPLVSYSYTESELKLFRSIVEWHLASVHCKTIPTTDCLIRYEDLLEFYNTLRKLRDSISSTTFKNPIATLPSRPPTTLSPALPSKSNVSSFELPTQVTSSMKNSSKIQSLPNTSDVSLQIARQQEQSSTNSKQSGWVQINNVFIPYIVKMKLRDNDSIKSRSRQPIPQLQREFYVPYEILIKCNIFSDQEFSFKKLLIKATQQDFDILNSLITNINIFDEKVPEKTLLVNLYHVMAGIDRILYIKFLPTKQPRTQVNKYHANVLTHKGGALLMNDNRLIPYIVQNNRFYVPLLYTFQTLPNILLQAKRSARAPRQYEIDYINLLFIYFSIDTSPLTHDTLLVDIFNIKCSNLQSPIHFRTLHEHQQYEKNKLSNAIINNTSSSSKPIAVSSAATCKSSKCPPTNVVVNPMIHHPSFYNYSSSKQTQSIKQPEVKTIFHDRHSLNAIVKSVDTPVNDWKILIKNIFRQFSFDIDYHKFIQWCQTNLLLPLVKLDDEEKKVLKHHSDYVEGDDDDFIYQRHLERCIALLNDLKHGSINMTLLPTSENELFQQQMTKASILAGMCIIVFSSHIFISISGAKKRKTIVPITRSQPSPSIINESNPSTDTLSLDIEPLLPNNSNTLVINDISMKSPNCQLTCPIVSDHDDDNDDDVMPVVASVEEEQPIEDLHQSDVDNSFVIVDSSDCNDERIQLDDTIPSCSSGYESSVAFTNTDTQNHENEDDVNSTTDSKEDLLKKTVNDSMIFSMNSKKNNKKRQRYKYGKSSIRPRSITPRTVKKPRSIDDNDDNLPFVTIIQRDQIEKHLRTLFMSFNELRRTRTRSVKIPTRLVEENTTSIDNNDSVKIMEQDSNVFDILSSSTASELTKETDPIEEVQSPCTYNVISTNNSNILGITIKKVLQSDSPE